MFALLTFLPVASLLVFGIGAAMGVRGDDMTQFALALLTLFVGLLPLIVDQGQRPSQRHILLSMFALVYMIHYVTPIFTYYMPAVGPIDAPGMSYTNLSGGDVIDGQVVALIGLLAMLASYASPVSSVVARLVPPIRRDWTPAVSIAIGCLMIPFGWSIQIAAALGLIPAALGSGFLSTLGSALIYGNVVLADAVVRFRSRVAITVLAVTIPVTSFLGFFTGSKTAALIVPVMVGLTVILLRRRIRLRWILLGILAITMLYPTAQFFRDVILVENTLTAVDALRNPTATLDRVGSFVESSRFGDYFLEGLEATGARLDCVGVTSVIVRDTPSASPFQKGATLILAPIAFIPRGLWPGKPNITIGQWITDTYGSGPHIESNTGPTQIGDFYLNFGTLGVIGGMLFLGFVLRIAHESLLRTVTAPGVLAAVVILYQLALRFEANVAVLYSGAVFALAPILFAHWVVRGMAGRSAPALGGDPGAGPSVERQLRV